MSYHAIRGPHTTRAMYPGRIAQTVFATFETQNTSPIKAYRMENGVKTYLGGFERNPKDTEKVLTWRILAVRTVCCRSKAVS